MKKQDIDHTGLSSIGFNALDFSSLTYFSRGATAHHPTGTSPFMASTPTIWLFALTLIEGEQHAVSTFWVGVLTGVGVLLGGAAIGAAIFERSGERLMEFVETT